MFYNYKQTLCKSLKSTGDSWMKNGDPVMKKFKHDLELGMQFRFLFCGLLVSIITELYVFGKLTNFFFYTGSHLQNF